MNKAIIENISEMIFISRKHLFDSSDVVIYHPGHFPELNIKILELYKNEGFKRLLIPDIYNQFLEANEFEFHKRQLIQLGLPESIVFPITGACNAHDVVKTAITMIKPEERNILLAGKAFFCRRFILLAGLFGDDHMNFDILPLHDDRGINKDNWNQMEKGRTRVINEMNVINDLLNQAKERGL
ncbi:hypothetical protein [Paenibacillus sp. P46E]|uniref:hypothetical protein n=1 Tax=Paenibacillus sp. P46E TaxID=1349436 RepID=UPI00093B75DD|nr:hypothetical protein [Paenibacillus sp. P46E]OKP94390.1 hypothetical protein A3849_29285 [Paenibacillus sp. P46E]